MYEHCILLSSLLCLQRSDGPYALVLVPTREVGDPFPFSLAECLNVGQMWIHRSLKNLKKHLSFCPPRKKHWMCVGILLAAILK